MFLTCNEKSVGKSDGCAVKKEITPKRRSMDSTKDGFDREGFGRSGTRPL